MKKNKLEKAASYIFIFSLLICRTTYLYFVEKNTFRQSMQQLGIEIGNFAIVAIIGFSIAFVFLYIQAKFLKRK